MGTSIDSPAPRNYGQETRDTLQAQVDLAPELYAAEAQFAPKYQDLQLGLLAKAAPQLMGIYERDIFPGLSRMEADTMARQRAADVEAVRTLGPQAQAALEAADPAKAALLNRMTQNAQAGLAAGNTLTPEQARQVQQATRGAYAARGVVQSPQAVFGEVLNTALTGNAEQDRRTANAANAIALRSQAYGDPFQAILGRPSATFATAAGYGAQAQGFNPGRLFNPESQYASDIASGNIQTQLAVDTANAANRTALAAAGIKAAGEAAGGAAKAM